MAAQAERLSEPTQGNRAGDPIGRLWGFLASPSSAALFLALTALLVVLSGILPQLPSDLADPNAQARWFAEVSARWGPAGAAFQSLGLFHVRDSLLWKACLGLGILTLLVLLEASIRRAWKGMQTDASLSVLSPSEERAVAAGADVALARLQVHLAGGGFRTRIAQTAGMTTLHALKRPWAAWLRVGAHLGALGIVAALLLEGVVGRAAQISLGPGESAPLGLRGGWSVLLKEFGEVSGVSNPYRGRVTVFGPEANLVGEGPVGTQIPVWAGGVTLHLSAIGDGLEVTATGADGKPLTLHSSSGTAESAPLFLHFDESQPEQYFAAPDVGDTVRVVLHPGGKGGRAEFLVQVYRGAEVEPRQEQLLADARSLHVDGVTYVFTPRPFATLAAVDNPLVWVLWAGAALVLVSLVLARAFPLAAILVRAAEFGGATHVQVFAGDEATLRAAREGLAAQTSGETA